MTDESCGLESVSYGPGEPDHVSHGRVAGWPGGRVVEWPGGRVLSGRWPSGRVRSAMAGQVRMPGVKLSEARDQNLGFLFRGEGIVNGTSRSRVGPLGRRKRRGGLT